jgi:protocatechuate 3,4-dioxygenase, alpha subunit
MTDRPREPADLVATASQTVGPFFHFGLAANEALGRVAPPDADGERIRLRVRVLDGDGAPVPDALIETYQADARGRYGASPFHGFGRLPTGEDGTCVFETVRPGAVSGEPGPQAPHVNVCVFARGLLRHLYTRIYFPDAGDLERDPLLALVPGPRRETLLARPAAGPGADSAEWEFVIRLQGAGETVFFDL